MPNNQDQNLSPEQLFKLWWVQLPMEQGAHIRAKIMEKCGWNYDQWYNRINQRGKLSGAEMNIIRDIAQEDIFFIDMEGDAMP
jgi:hypothetical protein